jgi:hypothetical protein
MPGHDSPAPKDHRKPETTPARRSPELPEREPMVRRDRDANASPQPGKDERRNRSV